MRMGGTPRVRARGRTERLLYRTWFSGASSIASVNAATAPAKSPLANCLLPCVLSCSIW